MYTLYTIPGTCSTGIAVLMEKLGVDYTLIQRDDVPNYTEIVPTNQVPAIKTEDGTIITEGSAIALFLLEQHGTALMPTDPLLRAEFYQWLQFDYATLHPAYSKLFTINFKLDIDEAVKQNLSHQLADQASALWKIVDQRAGKSKFITGDVPLHADYMLAIYSSWNNFFPELTIELGEHTKRLIKDVAALPEFKAAYAKESTEFKAAA